MNQSQDSPSNVDQQSIKILPMRSPEKPILLPKPKRKLLDYGSSC